MNERISKPSYPEHEFLTAANDFKIPISSLVDVVNFLSLTFVYNCAKRGVSLVSSPKHLVLIDKEYVAIIKRAMIDTFIKINIQ